MVLHTQCGYHLLQHRSWGRCDSKRAFGGQLLGCTAFLTMGTILAISSATRGELHRSVVLPRSSWAGIISPPNRKEAQSGCRWGRIPEHDKQVFTTQQLHHCSPRCRCLWAHLLPPTQSRWETFPSISQWGMGHLGLHFLFFGGS